MEPGYIMKTLSKDRINEIEKIGGNVHPDYITFKVNNQIYGEHCNDECRIWERIQKIIPGIDGALQGHPLDEADLDYIYFKLDF